MMEPKKIAMAIVSKIKPNGTEQSQDLVEGDEDDMAPLRSMAEEMINAIGQRDAGQLAESLYEAWCYLESIEDEEDEGPLVTNLDKN